MAEHTNFSKLNYENVTLSCSFETSVEVCFETLRDAVLFSNASHCPSRPFCNPSP